MAYERAHLKKQRGVVLFVSLVALLVMSLAAVALIRSVDTSTLIAGNLAFKQAATTSADAGTESAIAWLETIYNNNIAKDVYNDTTHPFNNNDATRGYYSYDNPDNPLDLFDVDNWNAITNIASVADGSGNTIRYIIQRMCRNPAPPNPLLLSIQNCKFSAAAVDNNGMAIPLPQDVCTGPGCPAAGQSPMYRITARVTGPRSTVSYIQSFVY